MGWGDWGTYINNMTKKIILKYTQRKAFTILKIMFPRHTCKNCLSCCLATNQGSMNADRLVRTIPCRGEKTRRGRNKRTAFRTGKAHGSRDVSGTKYGHWWSGLWRQSALRLTCLEVGDRGATVHTTHLVKTPATQISNLIFSENYLHRPLGAELYLQMCIQGEGWVEIREWAVELKIPNHMKPKALIIMIWLWRKLEHFE